MVWRLRQRGQPALALAGLLAVYAITIACVLRLIGLL